jgi:hypothetical protein
VELPQRLQSVSPPEDEHVDLVERFQKLTIEVEWASARSRLRAKCSAA